MRGEEKADDYSETKERDGIFFLQADTCDHTEPEPIARLVALDGEDGKVGAAHPKIRFEAVGAEQAGIRQILRRDHDGDRAEQQGEAASAKLAGEYGGLDYQKRGRQRGDETNAAERIPEYGTAHVSQEWNEWRLVDISPGKVIAARHVIELVAKVAVAVVEVNMEEEFGKRDRPDDRHTKSEEGLVIARGNCRRRCGHEWKRIAEDGGSVIACLKSRILESSNTITQWLGVD